MDIDNKYGALEYQKQTFSMMKDIHSFCIDNKIAYSLSGGSLLGAIRENGFIPWDDDMDIMMDRENFEKFLKVSDIIKGYVVSRMLWIYRIQREEDYNGSLTGPTIDVFVLDRVPCSVIKQKFKIIMLRFLQGMMKRHNNYIHYSPLKRLPVLVTYGIGKLFSDFTKFKWYDAVSQIGKEDDSEYLGCYDDLYKYLPKKYSADLMKRFEVHCFEDTEFYITCMFDNYLSVVYGDYMTPPPVAERKPLHT